MNRLILFCSLLIVLVVVEGCADNLINHNFHDNSLYESYNKTLSIEFLNWFDEEINVDYLHVKCIFDESCSGNISFNIETDYLDDPVSVNSTLSNYGNVRSFRCHETQEVCVFALVPYNLYYVNGVLSLDYVNKVKFSKLNSNYEYDDIDADKLFDCKIDNDCISVTGCCGCSESGNRIAINKNYERYWYPRLALECRDSSCAPAVSQDISCSSKPKCINNACVLIDEGNNVVEVKDKIKNEYCKTSYYKKCELGNFSHGFDETLVVYGLSCREALELCGGKYA